jgi:hypothetical protein
MRAFGRLCLIYFVLFLTAHDLPAPIIEENVTPTPSPKKDIATATPKAAATPSIAAPVPESAAKANGDGQTAQVTMKGLLLNDTTTFHRGQLGSTH